MLIPVHHISVNWCCLVQVHPIELMLNTGIQFIPQNAIQFLPHCVYLFNWNCLHMCLGDLIKPEKLGSYWTIWKYFWIGMSAHILHRYFILPTFRARHPGLSFHIWRGLPGGLFPTKTFIHAVSISFSSIYHSSWWRVQITQLLINPLPAAI
jgi:hypothetical protein